MRKFDYTGIFFDEINEKVIRLMSDNTFAISNEKPHITIQENPQNIPWDLIGTPIIVEIYGYGNDGINEGVCCRLKSVKAEMQQLLDKVTKPYISLFTSKGGNPANAQNLKFEEFSVPYVCKGLFGAI
jgi:hypothetical protein